MSLTYRPEIDGLRAIAVVAVVLYHADAALLPSGFVGVDVFFVISGYLITSLLVREYARTGRIDMPAFWARRARRILPALVVLVAVVSIAAAALLSRHASFDSIAGSAIASLLFVANFWFQATTGGYFDAAAETMPLMHLWSLAVEEQYYLVYPLLLAALLRWVPGRTRPLLALLAVASLLLAEYWMHIDSESAFFQMPARFWELAAGALVAMSPPRSLRPGLDRILVPGGTMLVLAACLFTRWDAFPAAGAVPAVAGAAVALLGIHRGAVDNSVAAALRLRPVVWVGLLSYSLYLWHWPLLVFDDRLRMTEVTLSWRLALCGFALGLAWLSWRFVEQPVRRNRSSTGRTLTAAGAAIAACMIVVLLSGRVDDVPPDARALAERAARDTPTELRCHLSSDDAIEVESLEACSSEPGRLPVVVIWGDSHASAWRPLAWALAAFEDVTVAGLTMNSCAPSGFAQDGGRIPAMRPCTDHNAFALRALSEKAVDTVIVSMRWPLGEPPELLDQRLAGLDAALTQLRNVRRIVVIGPLPYLHRTTPECIQLGWTDKCGLQRDAFDAAAAPVWGALATLPKLYANVQLVDPAPWFCNARECPALRDGLPLFRDKDHLTATAAGEFAAAWLADPERYDRTHGLVAPPEGR